MKYFLSLCLKFVMKEMKIFFFHIKTTFRSNHSQIFLKFLQYSQEDTCFGVSFE